MADLNLKAGTNMSIRQEDTDLYIDNTYEYDDTEIQDELLTRSLITETGKTIELMLNNTNYKLTAILKDKYGNVISTSNEIDLPIETLVSSIYYDSTTKEIVFVLKDGTTTRVPLLDLIDGLATEEDLQTLEDNVNETIQTFEDDINEDMETFKGDVEQELEKAQQDLEMYKMLENALPKVEGEGENITLDGTAKSPMKLGFKGQIKQNSTTGKNLLQRATGKTENGITFTILDDNSVKVSGTATANTSLNFSTEATGNVINIPAGTYVLSGCPSGGSSSTYKLSTNIADIASNDYGSGVTITANTEQTSRAVWITIYSGTTCNNLIFKPMLRLSNTTDDYEPYTNGATPRPDYEQPVHIVSGDNEIKVCNKNLFDKNRNINTTFTSSIATALQHYISTGEYATGYLDQPNNNKIASQSNYATAFLKVKKGETYTIYPRYDITTNYNFAQIFFLDNNANIISYSSRWIQTPYTHTIDNNEEYIAFSFRIDKELPVINYVQIEKGSTETDYVEHQEYTKEINLGELEVGGIGEYDDEFFKNTIDSEYYDSTLLKDKWYLKKKIGKVVLDGTETWANTVNQVGTSNFYRFSCSDFQDTTKYMANTLYISDNFTYVTNTLQEKNVIGNTITADLNRLYITIDTTLVGGTATSDFKNWLSTHNTLVYYILATPENILLNDTLQETLDSFYSMQEQTNIRQENNDLSFVIKASAIYDLSNLVTRVAVLESEG